MFDHLTIRVSGRAVSERFSDALLPLLALPAGHLADRLSRRLVFRGLPEPLAAADV